MTSFSSFGWTQLSVCTIILHQYVSTFPTEVEVIWTRQLTSLTAILFLMNRYNLLFLAGLYTVSLSCTSHPNAAMLVILASLVCTEPRLTYSVSCDFVSTLGAVSNLIAFAVWAAFCALRVYSIDNRNKHLAGIVFLLGMVPFVANTYGCTKALSGGLDMVQGTLCGKGWPISQTGIVIWSSSTVISLVVLTRTCLMTCDLIVLLVTRNNTLSANCSRRPRDEPKSSVFDLLRRDGTISFVLLMLLNIAHMVLVITGTYDTLAGYSIPLSSMIISHFILTLRRLYLSPPQPNSLHDQWPMPSQVSAVHFTTIGVESLDYSRSYSIQAATSHTSQSLSAIRSGESMDRLTGSAERSDDGGFHDAFSV